MTSTLKRRPRRIAADEAHAWARNLRLNNPLGKLTLSMLTLYVSGDGACFVSIEQLAEDTELAADTVRKRLAWLETIGAIARLPQWVDASGRRNGEGRGRRTSDEIRLLITSDEDVIESRAQGEAAESNEARKNETDGHDVESSPRSVTPSPQWRANGTSPRLDPPLAPDRPSDSGEGLISEPELEPEESPPNPPPGGSGPSDMEDWKKFKAAWHHPITRQDLCLTIWAALSEAEREQATCAAAGYVAWRDHERRPPTLMNAERFLRQPLSWADYAKYAPKPRTVDPPQPRISIAADSAEYVALQLACRIAGIEPPKPGDDGTVAFLGDVPHGANAMAMLAHEPAQWIVRRKDTREFTAWCERVKEWTGRWPEAKRYWLDEHGNVVPKEQAYIPPERKQWGVPNSIDGLRVPDTPTGFPPAKGGDPPREENESAA